MAAMLVQLQLHQFPSPLPARTLASLRVVFEQLEVQLEVAKSVLLPPRLALRRCCQHRAHDGLACLRPGVTVRCPHSLFTRDQVICPYLAQQTCLPLAVSSMCVA